MSDMLLTYTATNRFGEPVSSLYCYVEPQGLTYVDPCTGRTVGEIEADLLGQYGMYGEVKTTVHANAETYYKDIYEYMVAKEVSQERFDEMLDVLPPYRWNRNSIFEAWVVDECLVGNLFNVFIHDKSCDKYFQIVAEKSVNYTELLTHIRENGFKALVQ